MGTIQDCAGFRYHGGIFFPIWLFSNFVKSNDPRGFLEFLELVCSLLANPIYSGTGTDIHTSHKSGSWSGVGLIRTSLPRTQKFEDSPPAGRTLWFRKLYPRKEIVGGDVLSIVHRSEDRELTP